MNKNALQDLRDNFKYKEDSNKGYWCVLSKTERGKNIGMYEGDCEDFALTALYLYCDSNWRTFWKEVIFGDAKIRRVKSPSGGNHAILQFDKEYIDNWAMEWQSKRELKELRYKFFTAKHFWFTVIHKLAWSKIRGRW